MEKLEDVFVYDETSSTGIRWKVDRFSGRYNNIVSAYAGDVAGSLDFKKEAYVTRFRKKSIKVHNVVALLHGFDISEGVVDHIDGDPTNNRVGNLRVVTGVINSHNRRKQHNNTSGVVGVTKWKDQRGSWFWLARWQDSVGKRGAKSFSIMKYGDTESFKLAKEYRSNKIAELNKLGHEYTERHGK